jgi:uncharacterized protein (TIGR02646 family)
MRKVRPGKAPVYLAARGSPGKSETESAIAFFRQRANRQKPFAFAAYKHVSVKEALNSLFHFKCAYCESSFRAVHPLDIEHYRPKSGYVIRDRLRKPGYYWLAATWTNLLPSCIDCNRPRYQDVGDDDPEVAGKANKFPLRNERSRARRPGDEELEERLLLNPYLDRPGDHLTFMPDGIVRAKLRRSGESEMGKASIETYALQRRGLVDERRDRAAEIAALMHAVEEWSAEFQETGSARAEQNLRDEITLLKEALLPNRPYTSMAKQMIEPFLRRMTV